MEVRLPRRRFPPGLPGFPGNLRKRHFLPFFRLCAAASSPALLCCSERGVAELLGCGLARAALGMQSMTEPELKALMEQCTCGWADLFFQTPEIDGRTLHSQGHSTAGEDVAKANKKMLAMSKEMAALKADFDKAKREQAAKIAAEEAGGRILPTP